MSIRRRGIVVVLGIVCLALAIVLAGCDSASSGDTGGSGGNPGAPATSGQSPAGPTATAGSSGPTACQIPATPAATPGSGGHYITSVVTATGIDSQDHPTGVTSHFTPGATVYVVVTVHGVTDGQSHLISVRWSIGGQDVSLQQHSGSLGQPIPGDGTYAFSASFHSTGTGTVKIYWDLPLSDSTLADTLLFGIGVAC